MKNKYKMSIFSLQRNLLFVLIDCGTGFDFQGAFDHLFGNVNRRACSFFVFQPLLRQNKTREGDIMQWVSERGFYLIYTMLNISSEMALENGRDKSNEMHGITLGNFREFVMV